MQNDGMFAYTHHSPTLSDRKVDTVKEWLFNSSFIFHSDHICFFWKRLHSMKSDITAVASRSNNWILLIKLVHKRILLKPIQIIKLENATLNSKRVVKICYSNSLPTHRVILKVWVFQSQAGTSWLNIRCVWYKPVPLTVKPLTPRTDPSSCQNAQPKGWCLQSLN